MTSESSMRSDFKQSSMSLSEDQIRVQALWKLGLGQRNESIILFPATAVNLRNYHDILPGYDVAFLDESLTDPYHFCGGLAAHFDMYSGSLKLLRKESVEAGVKRYGESMELILAMDYQRRLDMGLNIELYLSFRKNQWKQSVEFRKFNQLSANLQDESTVRKMKSAIERAWNYEMNNFDGLFHLHDVLANLSKSSLKAAGLRSVEHAMQLWLHNHEKRLDELKIQIHSLGPAEPYFHRLELMILESRLKLLRNIRYKPELAPLTPYAPISLDNLFKIKDNRGKEVHQLPWDVFRQTMCESASSENTSNISSV